MSDITQEDGPPDDKKMPLLEHLIELRGRLIWSVATFFACFLVAYLVFREPIFNFLSQPLYDVFKAQGKPDPKIIFTGPTEAFFTYVKVAAFTAVAVGFPVIAGQIWLFVAPGLYKNERQAFLPFMLATPFMFLLGSALLYYVVLPVALTFFIGFEVAPGPNQMGISAEVRMSEYLSLVMTLILAFGISFELPVLLVLLVRVGMLSSQTLADKRRYAIVAVVAFAGIVTPPDVFSQLSLAVPLYGLYEASIWISKFWIERDREKKQREADAALKAKPKPKPKSTAAASPEAASTGTAAAAVAIDETDFNLAR